MCKENEGDKVQIVKDYEQKYKPVMEALQKEVVHATRATEKLEKENQIKYSELNESIKEIREKIVGVGIGNISEIATIRDLKEVVPTDSFSEARASKDGSDIVATVKEKGTVCGVVTISNKCTQHVRVWSLAHEKN
jgi:vacuolar-type H+-ATPase subunit H